MLRTNCYLDPTRRSPGLKNQDGKDVQRVGEASPARWGPSRLVSLRLQSGAFVDWADGRGLYLLPRPYGLHFDDCFVPKQAHTVLLRFRRAFRCSAARKACRIAISQQRTIRGPVGDASKRLSSSPTTVDHSRRRNRVFIRTSRHRIHCTPTIPKGWRWSVRRDQIDRGGTCYNREDAIQKAKVFIDNLLRRDTRASWVSEGTLPQEHTQNLPTGSR